MTEAIIGEVRDPSGIEEEGSCRERSHKVKTGLSQSDIKGTEMPVCMEVEAVTQDTKIQAKQP